MKSLINRFFGTGSNSAMTSFGLLILRVWLGLSMLILHGWGKVTGFSEMAAKFPQILPVSASVNLGLLVFAEVVCAALLVFGFLTRFAALVLGFAMAVAFFVGHKGALTGEQSGEIAFLYLAGYTCLLFAGTGRFSADAMLFGGKR